MTRKLAVFDVDGTLVDSRRLLLGASNAAFAAIGLEPPPYEALRQIVGLSLADGLALLAPDMDVKERALLADHYRTSFSDLHRDPAFVEPLYPGAAELLDRLKRQGWLVAMATGKSRRGVNAIIKMHGWADLFDSTHCSDDGPGKPHPAMLIQAMRALGAETWETIMIGDTAHDILMAKAARVRAQAVTWGFHTREEVEAAGADHIVDSFAALETELDRFAARLDARASTTT